jgi:hypothetical protein
MAGRKCFIFELQPYHSVTRDAMVSMLSAWVLAIAETDTWIGHSKASELMYKYKLTSKAIEDMSVIVLDAMHDSGLYEHLNFNKAELINTVCQINKSDTAYVELEWV